LDGKLDEPEWELAEKVSNFTQRELNNGEPATELTIAAVLYSETSIYIAGWCYESEASKVTAKYMKRDFPYWEDDNFEVIFDTFLDKRNGYVFVVNPNGARADVQITDEGKGFNIDWNGVWNAAVFRDSTGWFVEMEIPFSTLRFADKEEQIWGVNFERNIRRKSEAVFWQGWSRDYDFEHVSHAGTLLGIRNIRPHNTIELLPFVTSGYQYSTNDETFVKKFGGDINYLITPTLKLNLTANTDFAQVESDRLEVNITRFSLYYPEKRGFFLEGKHFFEFNIDSRAQVFYSRRIGINNGREVPIIAGARIMGKEGRNNIGFLSIQTSSIDSIPTSKLFGFTAAARRI
jgi:hypothetical protein